MERAASANCITNQPQICPWSSIEDEFVQIDKQKIAIQQNKKELVKVLNSQFKQARAEKFNKILQQHRERLMKNKFSNSSKTISIQQKGTINTQKYNKYYSEINNRKAKSFTSKLSGFIFSRSNTLNRIPDQGSQMKCFNPKIVNVYEQKQQQIKRLYRPKTLNINADKFYRSLTKKSQMLNTRYSSISLMSNKEPQLLQGERKKVLLTCHHANTPMKTLISINLKNYRSSKSVERLKLEMERKNRKARNEKEDKNHVLDRIYQY